MPPSARLVLRISLHRIDWTEFERFRGEAARGRESSVCARRRVWAERRRLLALLFCNGAGPDRNCGGTDGAIFEAATERLGLIPSFQEGRVVPPVHGWSFKNRNPMKISKVIIVINESKPHAANTA